MVSDEEIPSTYAVMRQLRTHLREDEYLATVERLRCSGYRLAAVLRMPREVRGEVQDLGVSLLRQASLRG